MSKSETQNEVGEKKWQDLRDHRDLGEDFGPLSSFWERGGVVRALSKMSPELNG